MIAGFKNQTTIRRWPPMRILVSAKMLLFIGSLFASLSPLSAQTNAAANPKGSRSQRYLLVFETSRAMSRRSENSIKAAADLIRSGLNGQMRAGDTLGIWTFNDALSTGEFPLAKWSPETSRKLSSIAAGFLSQQKFEKGADLRQVIGV